MANKMTTMNKVRITISDADVFRVVRQMIASEKSDELARNNLQFEVYWTNYVKIRRLL